MQATLYYFKIVVIFISFLSAGLARADLLTEGNIIISHRGYIYEYSREGVLAQTFKVDRPTTNTSNEFARDIIVSSPADIHVYNGTFDPYMSSLKVDIEEWSHTTYDNWITYNNGTYGGIAAIDGYVFVTSMGTSKGVIRFDTNTGESIRFSETIDTTDLNLGLNGILYVLSDSYVIAFDPMTLEEVDRVNIRPAVGYSGGGIRSLAVDEDGDIFLADFTYDIYKLDSSGVLLKKVNIQNFMDTNSVVWNYDIDISEDGVVIVSSRDGFVTITDKEFSSVRNFVGPSHYAYGSFVSFVPYSIIPPALTITEPLNSDDCVEATGPNGTNIVISSENRNADAVLYNWITSDGDTGNDSSLNVQVGVNQTLDATLTFTDSDTNKTSTSSISICVTDTTAPEVKIISPETGDTIIGNNSKLHVSIFDAVDKDISEYDVVIGNSFTMSYTESNKNQNINLFKPTKNGKQVTFTVKAHDYSGNVGEANTSIILKHDNRQ